MISTTTTTTTTTNKKNKQTSHRSHACSHSLSLDTSGNSFFLYLHLKINSLSFIGIIRQLFFLDTLQYGYNVNTTVLNIFTVSAQIKHNVTRQVAT